jgi:hypothetical protein
MGGTGILEIDTAIHKAYAAHLCLEHVPKRLREYQTISELLVTGYIRETDQYHPERFYALRETDELQLTHDFIVRCDRFTALLDQYDLDPSTRLAKRFNALISYDHGRYSMTNRLESVFRKAALQNWSQSYVR